MSSAPEQNSTPGPGLPDPGAPDAHGPEHPLLWTPSPEQVEGSRMHAFARFAEERHGLELPDYPALHQWSVEHLDDFWTDVWDFFGVLASEPPRAAVEDPTMPGARWFPGARLNFAENMLRAAADRPDDPAIVGEHETGEPTVLSWRELEAQTAALAARFRELGVEPGDRVAAVLPNIPETVVALLATASVGAVWSVVNTDFGPQGVADRFAQIEPKVLLTVDGYEFGGKLRDTTGTIGPLREVLPTVEHVVVVDQQPRDAVGPLPEDVERYSEIVARPTAPRYEQVEAEHPLWVLYSSGTTGRPKGIVHSHAGIVLEFLKVLGLQADLGPEDVGYFAVATTWMVWNLHIGSLLTGAAIVVYDGSPGFGGPDKTFELVARNRATFLGTGAAVLTMVERSGIHPNTRHDLSSLKAVLVTGSPLPDSTWDWVYDAVSADLRLSSDSGGTDICSAFVGGNPLQPVHRGEIMGAYLGVDAQSWNSRGERVFDEVGEFVVVAPGPSMPVCFWNDPDGERYRDAYFAVFPGVWRHGDWTTQLRSGGFVIHGRSDSTINRGGIRMGSADLTQVVDGVDGVAASMVIGAELAGGDYYMPLFVVPEPGTRLTDELKDAITGEIRTRLSPRYVPDEIIEAPAVPRTRTGKLLEVPIKKLYQGADPSTLNRGTVEDTEVLDWYADRAREFVEERGPRAH